MTTPHIAYKLRTCRAEETPFSVERNLDGETHHVYFRTLQDARDWIEVDSLSVYCNFDENGRAIII